MLFVYLINTQWGWRYGLMIVCLCILDQGVFGQMSRHHTHTNALNPLASSASVGEGLRSHHSCQVAWLDAQEVLAWRKKKYLWHRDCVAVARRKGDEEQSQDQHEDRKVSREVQRAYPGRGAWMFQSRSKCRIISWAPADGREECDWWSEAAKCWPSWSICCPIPWTPAVRLPFPPTVRSLSGSPLPAEWVTAARVHLGSSRCPKLCAWFVFVYFKACARLSGVPLLTSLNKHRRECLDCMGAGALGPQCAGSELLTGMDVTDVYFCVHWTPAFQSYPLANLAVEASSEALFFRP